jgi:hypothetical protein
MNLATANLIIQINEKFEKDTQDNSVKNNELKEKQVLKKRLDSVYKPSAEINKK